MFRGYWNNEEATAAAIVDGWFHTGDLGSLDEDGYLSITGRKKELIVTAGGKNVAPAVLEDRVRAHRLVSQALVVGDNRPYIGALITLDPEALPGWSSEHGKDASDAATLAEDADLRAEISGAIDDANRAVSKAEAIKQWRILDERLHRGERRAHPDDEAQAQRHHREPRRRHRGGLRAALSPRASRRRANGAVRCFEAQRTPRSSGAAPTV